MKNPTKKKKIAMKKEKIEYRKHKGMDVIPFCMMTVYDLRRNGICGPRWRKRLQLHNNAMKKIFANYAKECFMHDFPN